MNGALSAHTSKEQNDQEKTLIQEAKKDPARFSPLYTKYYGQIFMFVLKRVESEDTAADIVSQVFLKALTSLPKYRDMGFPFSSWLYRIARNEMYDLYKRQKIQMVVSTERRGIGDMINEMGDTRKEDYDGLYVALEKLDGEEMEMIEMRFFEQRPFKEIGEILDITENNAKVRTYRVLDKLKKWMKDEK